MHSQDSLHYHLITNCYAWQVYRFYDKYLKSHTNDDLSLMDNNSIYSLNSTFPSFLTKHRGLHFTLKLPFIIHRQGTAEKKCYYPNNENSTLPSNIHSFNHILDNFFPSFDKKGTPTFYKIFLHTETETLISPNTFWRGKNNMGK